MFLHYLLMNDPIKLAASGNNTDKIALPDLVCSIFSFYIVVLFFKAIVSISF